MIIPGKLVRPFGAVPRAQYDRAAVRSEEPCMRTLVGRISITATDNTSFHGPPLCGGFDTRCAFLKDWASRYKGVNSIRIGVDVTPPSIRFDMYGRLMLTWHLTGSLLKVSVFRVWFQGTNKLKSAHLSKFHQVMRSSAYSSKRTRNVKGNAKPTTQILLQLSFHFIASPHRYHTIRCPH